MMEATTERSANNKLRDEMRRQMAEKRTAQAEEMKKRLDTQQEIEHTAHEKEAMAMASVRDQFPDDCTKVRCTDRESIFFIKDEKHVYSMVGTAYVGGEAKIVILQNKNQMNVNPSLFEAVNGSKPIPFESEEERRIWGHLPRKRLPAEELAVPDTVPAGERRRLDRIRLLETTIAKDKVTMTNLADEYVALTGIEFDRTF